MELELIKQIKELKEYLAMYAPTKEVEQSLLAEGTKKILEKPQIPKDILEVIDIPEKKKYTYPKEKIQEYTKRYYEKNKEKIITRSTAYLKDKYKTDPEFRERAKGYSKAFRDRQQLLVQEARKIVLENEARQKQAAYGTLYNA